MDFLDWLRQFGGAGGGLSGPQFGQQSPGAGMMAGVQGFDPSDPGASFGRTAGNADLGGYGGSPRLPDARPNMAANNLAMQGGMALMQAGAPQQTWQPSAIPTLQPHFGNPQMAGLANMAPMIGAAPQQPQNPFLQQLQALLQAGATQNAASSRLATLANTEPGKLAAPFAPSTSAFLAPIPCRQTNGRLACSLPSPATPFTALKRANEQSSERALPLRPETTPISAGTCGRRSSPARIDPAEILTLRRSRCRKAKDCRQQRMKRGGPFIRGQLRPLSPALPPRPRPAGDWPARCPRAGSPARPPLSRVTGGHERAGA